MQDNDLIVKWMGGRLKVQRGAQLKLVNISNVPVTVTRTREDIIRQTVIIGEHLEVDMRECMHGQRQTTSNSTVRSHTD